MEIELVKQMPPKSSGHNADVAFVLPNEGADAAELNGAWVSNSDACEKILVVRDGKITLSKDYYGGSGFVDEPFIRGKIATCKITSRKQAGKIVQLQAICATDIMLSNNKFSLVWVDDNKLVRINYRALPNWIRPTSDVKCKERTV